MDPRLVGTEPPNNGLPHNSTTVKDDKDPKLDGIVPPRLFPFTSNRLRDVRLPRDNGKLPDRLFLPIAIDVTRPPVLHVTPTQAHADPAEGLFPVHSHEVLPPANAFVAAAKSHMMRF